MTEDMQALSARAVKYHRSGEVSQSEPLYRAILDRQPENYDTLYLLGTAQLQLGRFDECIATFRRVLAARPDVPDAHNNLGVAYQATGKWEEAAKSYQQAIKVHPEYEQAFFNLGALMESRGLFTDAEKCFRHALELNPRDLNARIGLANSLRSQQRWKEAEAVYRDAADRANDVSVANDLQIQVAYVLAKQERLDEAMTIYDHFLETAPDYREIHQVHNSISYIRERAGQLDEAVDSARHAIELVPDFAEGYNNLGIALRAQHRLDDACSAFRQALKIRPDFSLAEFNLGTTHLLAGNYRAGWLGYERHSELSETPKREFRQPQWQGEFIGGKTLLVYCDQGFGDAIQFLRFVPRVQHQFGCKIVLECPPELKRLFEKQFPVAAIVVEGSPLPSFDLHVPLANLPGRLGIDLKSVGAGERYIELPKEIRPELKHLLHAADPGKLKIGINWQGNPKQARNVVRSCPFTALMPLMSIEGTQWFSLQTDANRFEQLVKFALPHRPIDLGVELRDFADTAAVMSRLDLILTVDTATAHLAGALGRPVWTMLCHTPDWRWHLDRDDSPWYPTMRLFRQPTWGNWNAVIQEVGEELENLVSAKR